MSLIPLTLGFVPLVDAAPLLVAQVLGFATGHRRAGEVTDWTACAAPSTTLACYMGVSTAPELRHGLLAAGWPATCPIEVVCKAQNPRRAVVRHV